MSKRSRTLKKARRLSASPTPVTKVRSPGDTLALVPYLFGFTPEESIVVIALDGPRKQFGPSFRLDLASPEHHDLLADRVLALVRRHGYTDVLVAVFSAIPDVADPFVEIVLAELRDAGVGIVDAFRGDGQRWWSYVCRDPLCCSPDGMLYDVGSSPAAVDAVLAGMAKAPDREALRDRFAPGDPTARQAVARVVDDLRRNQTPPLTPGEVANLMPALLAGEELAVSAQGHLLLSLCEVAQRDKVWVAMRRDTADDHLDVWRRLMRLAPDDLLAPVGSLAAFAAWLSGSGVLASHAVDRVLDLHPTYSMALLLRQAIDGAVDPREWTTRVT